MTNEEMERTMQFIVEQQAQITANFQKSDEERKEERAKDSARIKHLEESFLILVQLAANHNERMSTLDERMIALDERVISLTEALDERMLALTEAQIHTDEQLKETDGRLNSLIVVVENYITSRGQNGSSQS